MILALDPGESKIGWAVVTGEGEPSGQGILRVGDWQARLLELPHIGAVHTVVIGDGTARMNIEVELRRLLPHVTVAVVNEKESTVEAWQLKRIEHARGNPLRAIAFTLGQLFNAAPVDDYAARVLALRFLRGQR